MTPLAIATSLTSFGMLIFGILFIVYRRRLYSSTQYYQARAQLISQITSGGRQSFTSTLQFFIEQTSVRCGAWSVFEGEDSGELFFRSTVESDRMPLAGFTYLGKESISEIMARALSPEKSASAEMISIQRLPFSVDSVQDALSAVLIPFRNQTSTIAVLALMFPPSQRSHTRFDKLAEFSSIITPYLGEIVLRKQAEVAHLSSRVTARILEGRFEDIFENSHDAIVLCSSNGIVLDLNNSALTLSGISSKNQICGMHLKHFYSSGPGEDRILNILEKNARNQEIELIFHRSGDETRYGLATPGSISLENSEVEYFLIIKDITERIIRDAEMLKANTELELLNIRLKEQQAQIIQQEKLASIGQLSAGVAHEINNPLGFVQSNIETLRYILDEKCGSEKEDIQSIIDETNEGIRRISGIVRSLKDFSHTDDRPQEVDVESLLKNTITVSTNLYKYVAELDYSIEYDEPLFCYPDKLGQVFLNLIVNSTQAIASQKREDMGHIGILVKRHGRNLRFTFSDDGPGIPSKVLHRIFEPFFTTKDVGEGTGLGLSIAREIVVKLHKGTMHVQSSPDGGTVFNIDIPLDFAMSVSEID